MLALSAGSSVIQPVFGYFADRLNKPWLMALGLFLAGIGISFVGFAPTYWSIALAVAVSGFGTAAFHPEAARLTNCMARQHKATAMSYFSFGGNAGFAFGPLLAEVAHAICGLRGTVVLALPPVIMAAILLAHNRLFSSSHSNEHVASETSEPAEQSDSWKAFAGLSLVVTLRSIVFYGVSTFLPLFYIHVLHQHSAVGNTMLTLFFGVGAMGSLLGGSLADRFGNRRIIKYGFAMLCPVLLLWMYSNNVGLSGTLLMVSAIVYYAPFSAIVVLGQQYLPNRVGFASGVTLGLAVSIGGVVAPMLGRVADVYGLRPAILCVALLPILCAVVAFSLPSPFGKRGAKQSR